MRRRDFIAGFTAAAWPLAARAQQPNRVQRIGVLMSSPESDQAAQLWKTVFEQGLQKLGWTEHRNLMIEYRWAAADLDRYQTFATELVASHPDVLLAGGTPALEALQPLTRLVPIVFTLVGDPIGGGFVANLARPGGNITGFIPIEPALAGKWLEMLKEIAPNITRVAFLYNPETTSYAEAFLGYAQKAAAAYAVELIRASAHNDAEIEGALASFAREPNGGLIVLSSDFAQAHRAQIIGLATRHRLPAIHGHRQNVIEGGLLSYGTDFENDFRLAAGYVDRILRGERVAELPVQAPVKYELVVNLKAAKAIGLTIPETFLVRADRVIE